MKKLFLLFVAGAFLSSFTVNSFLADGNPVDKADLTKNFPTLLENAKNRFKDNAVVNFDGASSSLSKDETDLKSQISVYHFKAVSLDDAKAIKKEVSEWVKSLVPSDYKTYSTYKQGYAGYMIDVFEFNSDVFAEVSKKPVVRVGIILEEEGKYKLEITVSEPVFKTAQR